MQLPKPNARPSSGIGLFRAAKESFIAVLLVILVVAVFVGGFWIGGLVLTGPLGGIIGVILGLFVVLAIARYIHDRM